MGVPLNWTQSSGVVSDAFRSVGDYVRPGWIEDLAYLLDSGVKVSLWYGDRDYACNWIGGDRVSQLINYTDNAAFQEAGYAEVQTNESYVGGLVRQHGNLSFIRVFEAGHEIPSYQPETAYQMFVRTLFNMDIATGEQPTYSNGEAYSSGGTSDPWSYRNEPIEQPLQFCYTQDLTSRCTEDQILSILAGTAEVQSYIVCDKNSTQLFPELMSGCSAASSGGGNSTSGGGPSASASGSAPVVSATGAAMILEPGSTWWTVAAGMAILL